MTSFAEQAAIASRSDTINTQLGVFRGMAGNLAEVNVNGATVRVPCDGFTPPIPGMSVRVQWVNGSPSVTGPARPLNPRGVITGAGSPRATVTVEGQPYLMYLAAGYTPAVGDVVSIRWDYEGGLITGKVQGYETPKPPEPVPPPPQSFTDLVVRAENSGRFQSGVGWWGNDPWASSNNNGLWTYGNRVKDALAGASNLVADIYLPLVRELSGGQLALHQHPTIPGGAPTFQDAWNPPTHNGWVRLPDGWANFLAVGGRGVGVTNGGYTIWRGTALDGSSGAFRFSGTR